MKYISVQKIAQVRLLCRKVLPAVYDESLSYLEGLSKLTFKLNETIDSVNALNDNVGILNDSVTELNSRVEAVEGEIEGFEAEIIRRIGELEVSLTDKIDTSVSAMETKVDTKLAEVDTKLSDMEVRIAGMEQYVQETVDKLTADFTALIAAEIARINELYLSFEGEMRQYVEDTVNELIQNIPDLTNIYVVSPASGKLVKVQVAINEVFDFHLYYALTCDEYNTLDLTCNDINSLMVDSLPRGFTVREWLHDAKKLLMKILPVKKIEKWLEPHSVEFGVLTGVKDWLYKNVELNSNVWLWSGTFTCDEIVTLGKTCDEINEYGMSCEEYMMSANAVMV